MKSLALSLSFLTLLACSSHSHEADPDGEACEHLADGPAVPVTAAAASSASAPAIAADHKRYDVTLGDVTGGKAGFVSFASAAAGDLTIYTSETAQLAVRDPAGAEIVAESSAASSATCPAIKGRHVYEMKVGGHVIEVRSAAARVSLVLEAGHAH